MINVKNFGAKGDGKNNDTAFLRAAIERGGEIYFPAGTYVTGTLQIPSNATLRFAAGARLLASLNAADYIAADYDEDSRHDRHPSPYFFPEEGREQYGLLYAFGAENIRIIGGTLAADDKAYCRPEPLESIITDENSIYAPFYFRQPATWRRPVRPRPKMLLFKKCKNLFAEGLRVEKAPCFSGWFLGCENLTFDGMTVRNDYDQPSADGLHFSSCKNVLVKNCDFHCGDDCVAVDCAYGKPCENVTVKNCVLETSIHAIRIYSGLDLDVIYGRNTGAYVKNVTVENCRVREGCAALLINACDGDISDVLYKDIVMEQSFCGTALCFTASEGTLSGVTVENLRFKGNGGGYFYAEKNGRIDGVTVKNCAFEITPKPKKWADDYDEMITHAYSLPYGFVLRNADNVSFENADVFIGETDASEYTNEELAILKSAVGEERYAALFAPAMPFAVHGCKNFKKN
ncbi:MAG: hypothetical protein DBX59_05315 [Bacillota bacterium]|nr:MAG: hypothetical protein DBX59_05315 [Bacillota bacterium]